MASLLFLIASGLGFVAIANALPGPPEITPAPVLPRQDDQGVNFIGYTSTLGQWFPESCVYGSAPIVSGDYMACAPTDATEFGIATTCLGGSVLVVPPGNSYPCSPYVCYTILVFDNINDKSPNSGFACDSFSRVASLYRTTPATTSTALGGGGAGSFSRLTPPTAAPTSAEEITSTLSSSSSSATSSPASSSTPASSISGTGGSGGGGGGSKAWIAGAVIGPIAGIAIIGLAFWVWRLRRKQKQMPGNTQPVVQGQEKPSQPQMAHWPAQSGQKAELPSENHAYHASPVSPVSPIEQRSSGWGRSGGNMGGRPSEMA